MKCIVYYKYSFDRDQYWQTYTGDEDELYEIYEYNLIGGKSKLIKQSHWRFMWKWGGYNTTDIVNRKTGKLDFWINPVKDMVFSFLSPNLTRHAMKITRLTEAELFLELL